MDESTAQQTPFLPGASSSVERRRSSSLEGHVLRSATSTKGRFRFVPSASHGHTLNFKSNQTGLVVAYAREGCALLDPQLFCLLAAEAILPQAVQFVARLQPFERVHADWCHIPEVGEVLVIVDAASGWIECSLHQARTTANVIDSLSVVFSRFCVPKTLVTDNGAEFTSREMSHFCACNDIAKTENPPYHPQSIGAAERSVQTIKNGMKAWRIDVAYVSFREYEKNLVHEEIAPSSSCLLLATRGEDTGSFSQPVHLRSRDGTLRRVSFLLERGSNTSWVLYNINKLQLAHRDQLSHRPTSTPISSPRKELENDTDATLPMVDTSDTQAGSSAPSRIFSPPAVNE